ncbi:hypothetical protein [Helicobacter rodentium]|nr:hypothetical protein [Helicobacter rodentium]
MQHYRLLHLSLYSFLAMTEVGTQWLVFLSLRDSARNRGNL